MKIKIKKGKWQTGNLYDALVAAAFDKFINEHRTLEFVKLRASKIPNLKRHNYEFNWKR